MKVRKAEDRGLTQLDWLYSRHSFSFGEYYDPREMGFRSLRVINDDTISPNRGFGMHGHRDMEIITLVFDGALEHRDSLGHGEVIQPGDVQVMTAGRGIRHSEFNPSEKKSVHLLQIWIEPSDKGLAPAYAQRSFSMEDRTSKLVRVAGLRKNKDQALPINQDADVYVSTLLHGGSLTFDIRPRRALWVQCVRGACSIDGISIRSGDGAAIETAGPLTIIGEAEKTEIILFDLA